MIHISCLYRRWAGVAVAIALIILSIDAKVLAQTPGDAPNVTTETAAAPTSADAPDVRPVRTGSPRLTIESFEYLAAALEGEVFAYRQNKTSARLADINTLFDQLLALIDLAEVPPASRREVGMTTALALLDIVTRVGLPSLQSIPDANAFADDPTATWRIPETSLRLVRLDDGPRQGEFLFSAATVRTAPRFASTLDGPMESDLSFSSWSRGWPQITGTMIPAEFVRAMPDDLRMLWHVTPRWKTFAVFGSVLIAAVVLALFTRAVWPSPTASRTVRLARRFIPPIVTLVVIGALGRFFDNQLVLSGAFASWVATVAVVLSYFTLAWLFWVAVTGAFNWVLGAPGESRQTLNASLITLGARILALFGVLVILGAGATRLGLPVMSVVAGLGVSSLAVALAVRPSLENLIGGVVLFADRPVRVGDFCSFGSYMGTVEAIGIRSTQIRGLDRTRISIPNAKFADMEIINWAQCDQMLINDTIGLRYETGPDQLRYVLGQLRAMAHAHPRIASDTIRIRFAGYGESALNIGIRIYAQTREWNDFYAIREDIYLRVNEIVHEAGTDFAVPASRLYMSRDAGLDVVRTDHAKEKVETWREAGTLPFPFMSQDQVQKVAGTVPYPPLGSVDLGEEGAVRRRAEHLSGDVEPIEDAEIEETQQETLVRQS
ncbi:mechanosensitive ion channel family protein [Acuticoccus sp. M5D2P5]|uniref:mechanosensitive ion channel family protein n=1 Tax=Acuticoccus kalidii TaxID=2910977 RepID=UPI001F267507|nr:mechanosensitive ion channel family protein [Acuticoccus kalidii]MCF3934572.1 mechanosensitive ion channel family protein [Acuticoccus kalidii]